MIYGVYGLKRKYPSQPIVAVAALIVNDKNEILIIKRGSEPGKGLWSIPGGVVELGEHLHQALRREVKEETGLEILPLELLDVFEVLDHDSSGSLRYHYIIIDYLAKSCGGELKASTDASEVRWVSLNNISSYNVTRSLRLLLDRYRYKLIKDI